MKRITIACALALAACTSASATPLDKRVVALHQLYANNAQAHPETFTRLKRENHDGCNELDHHLYVEGVTPTTQMLGEMSACVIASAPHEKMSALMAVITAVGIYATIQGQFPSLPTLQTLATEAFSGPPAPVGISPGFELIGQLHGPFGFGPTGDSPTAPSGDATSGGDSGGDSGGGCGGNGCAIKED